MSGSVSDFKGVWIPRELWLTKNLKPMEKFFLLEIESLDGENGCFASNAHFSDLFDVSKGRCTQIIKKLESNGWVKIELTREGKQIVKRTIRVVNKLNNPSEKIKQGSEKIKQPYLENDEGNNTNINISTTTTAEAENVDIKKSNIKKLIADDWQPSDRCFELMTRAGISREFASGLIDEFVLYWSDRGDKRIAWNSTFLNHVKSQFEKHKSSRMTVGNKGIKHAAHSEFDEKYRHLQVVSNG